MKHRFGLFMFLILFTTAGNPGISNAECKEGICILIKVEGPVKALEPARFVISIKTEKDISKLPVGFSIFPGIIISDIEKIPESAKLVYQDKTGIGWQIDTKGGEEYFFSGYIVLSKPTVSYGIFSYLISAYFSQPTYGRVSDSKTIFLDAEGNQVEESKAQSLLQTGFPAPTAPPDLTIVPETPMPAVAWPTEAPLLPMTLTAAAYLAPDNPSSILPVYPYP